MQTTASPVAVFDFDGTIIAGDSFLPFMQYVVGRSNYYQGFVRLLPWLGGYALGAVDNRRIKEKVIGCFLKGLSHQEVEEKGRAYAKEILLNREKPEMLEKIRWHHQKQHWVVLASASLLVYLKPWAEARNFHGICGAELEVDEAGRITGRIKGNNGFGQEKVDAVEQWLDSRKPSLTYAYGDSAGDKELLEWADVKVYKGQQLAESQQAS